MKEAELLHEAAMEFCDLAYEAKAQGNPKGASAYLLDAFEKERQAANSVAADLTCEPTRSILHRSAAALALDCGLHREAERLIAAALAGDPPNRIAEELRDLLVEVHFKRIPLRMAENPSPIPLDQNGTSD